LPSAIERLRGVRLKPVEEIIMTYDMATLQGTKMMLSRISDRLPGLVNLIKFINSYSR
jgi:hypothetical protein